MSDPTADLQPVRLTILVDRTSLGGRGRGIFFAQGDRVSADEINEMARSGRGLIAAALTAERAFALGIAPLAQARRDTTA
ncbi:MAG: 3,4-dihydroxy-2-butanone-4-phosphate synthase, partial [Sandaracinobacteroides sp.]